MTKRNLIVQLDDTVIRRAGVTAAKRGTSVSGLVTQQLERLADADERYEDAQRRAERALVPSAPRGGRRWTRDGLTNVERAFIGDRFRRPTYWSTPRPASGGDHQLGPGYFRDPHVGGLDAATGQTRQVSRTIR
jgi:hypothetical protein